MSYQLSVICSLITVLKRRFLLEELITNYGYLAIFVGTFFEGESVLIAGGLFAKAGLLNVLTIITIGTTASFVGHGVAFILAFKKREKFVNFLTNHTKADISKLHKLIERWGTWAIFITQYIYGFRILSAAVLGLTEMGPKKYFTLQLLSCVIWAVIITLIGYSFGHVFEAFIGDIKKYAFYIGIVIIAGGFIIWVIRDVKRQKDN